MKYLLFRMLFIKMRTAKKCCIMSQRETEVVIWPHKNRFKKLVLLKQTVFSYKIIYKK